MCTTILTKSKTRMNIFNQDKNLDKIAVLVLSLRKCDLEGSCELGIEIGCYLRNCNTNTC